MEIMNKFKIYKKFNLNIKVFVFVGCVIVNDFRLDGFLWLFFFILLILDDSLMKLFDFVFFCRNL